MMKLRTFVACLVVLLILAVVPTVTSAWDTCLGPSSGPFAFGHSGTLYGLGYLPVPPYYALHPPVYYGERYYRSYGESPFARPAYSSRGKRIEVRLIMNPFVESLPAAITPLVPEVNESAEVDQVTVKPLMIVNPFYKAEEKVARN